MALLGAHMSIAGGYYKAVDAAAALGMDVVQVFTKNNNQWRAVPITDEDVRLFRVALEKGKITAPLAHASYLINLASPDDALRNRSIQGMVIELQRATLLGIPYVVVHPGAHMSLTPEQGLERIVAAINDIHDQFGSTGAEILLENTAGQGSCLGWQFEQLGEILRRVRYPQRLGVCLDTCHAFAAGYEFSRADQFQGLLAAFDSAIGLDRLRAIHLNDSKREAGARVDRHEHIGLGKIGLESFWRLLRDPRLRSIPMYLETHKDNDGGHQLDQRNLRVLRALAACRTLRAARAVLDEE